MAFFGPYRDELLARYGVDRRQISSRELPLQLSASMTPPRSSLDVGDLDEPVLPSQRCPFRSLDFTRGPLPAHEFDHKGFQSLGL